MNKLSALGIAGALLLGASIPALAQSYSVDPGYDQGPAYGPPEAPVEELAPGLHYGPDPVYGGDYAGPEDDFGDGGPDRYPAYGGEDWRRHHPRHDQGRYGEGFGREGQAFNREGQRRPDGDFGDRGRRKPSAEQHRRMPRPDEDMSDDGQ